MALAIMKTQKNKKQDKWDFIEQKVCSSEKSIKRIKKVNHGENIHMTYIWQRTFIQIM